VFSLDNDTGLLGCGDETSPSLVHIIQFCFLVFMLLFNPIIALCVNNTLIQSISTILSVACSVWLCQNTFSRITKSLSTYDWISDGMKGVDFVEKPKHIDALWNYNAGGVYGQIFSGIFLSVSSIIICVWLCKNYCGCCESTPEIRGNRSINSSDSERLPIHARRSRNFEEELWGDSYSSFKRSSDSPPPKKKTSLSTSSTKSSYGSYTSAITSSYSPPPKKTTSLSTSSTKSSYGSYTSVITPSDSPPPKKTTSISTSSTMSSYSPSISVITPSYSPPPKKATSPDLTPLLKTSPDYSQPKCKTEPVFVFIS